MLDEFALNGESTAMHERLGNEVYAIDRIAIQGESTVIYAPPNTGKTLLAIYGLIERISAGDLNPEKTFYVNADDSYRGLVHKLMIAETFNFRMLAPGFRELRADDVVDMIDAMAQEGSAEGITIVLDTVKRFTSLMDKRAASAFTNIIRQFTQKGGTVIALAHVNKHKNSEGKSVHAGTTDLKDDFDCAFVADIVDDNGAERTIILRNEKNRGDVNRESVYQYSSRDENYTSLLKSVRRVSEDEAATSKRAAAVAAKLEKNSIGIDAITEAINEGHKAKTDLIKAAQRICGISRVKLISILSDHEGTVFSKGHRWTEVKGLKNARHYKAIEPFTADDYRRASEGEWGH